MEGRELNAAYCPQQEFFEGDKTLVIDQCELNQSVNLFGVKNSTLQIKGKVNAVTLGKSC